MKKVTVLVLALLVVCMSVGFCSCGNSKEEESVVNYKDQAFLSDLATGLQHAWDIEVTENQVKKENELIDLYEQEYDAELTNLDHYKDASFKSKRLEELADKYIDALHTGKDALKYYKEDHDRFEEAQDSMYSIRNGVLLELIRDYGFEVDSKHQEYLDEMLSNSASSKLNGDKDENIEEFVSKFDFKRVDDDYDSDYHDYEAVVKNTTGIDFKEFNVDINLLDKKGTILETENDEKNNYDNGKKVKFEFSTDVKFDKVEVICTSWSE